MAGLNFLGTIRAGGGSPQLVALIQELQTPGKVFGSEEDTQEAASLLKQTGFHIVQIYAPRSLEARLPYQERPNLCVFEDMEQVQAYIKDHEARVESLSPNEKKIYRIYTGPYQEHIAKLASSLMRTGKVHPKYEGEHNAISEKLLRLLDAA